MLETNNVITLESRTFGELADDKVLDVSYSPFQCLKNLSCPSVTWRHKEGAILEKEKSPSRLYWKHLLAAWLQLYRLRKHKQKFLLDKLPDLRHPVTAAWTECCGTCSISCGKRDWLGDLTTWPRSCAKKDPVGNLAAPVSRKSETLRSGKWAGQPVSIWSPGPADSHLRSSNH